jgi:hypothetical protein
MSQSASQEIPAPYTGPLLFTAAGLVLASLSALLAGWAPLSFSLVTVFLFAGPHNWLEFRYLLTRMPAWWGRQRLFFSLAIGGVLLLSLGFVALVWAVELGGLDESAWMISYALLNSLLVLWIALLAHLRSRLTPRRDWGWVWPVAFLLIALAWLMPPQWGLALVYLHPLMAFWLLDRELRRSRPHWRPALHACLVCVPLFLGLLWWKLASTPSLPADDELARRITDHAGAALLGGVSSHLLVATHAFLEMLHYGVWVLAMPLLGLRALPWKLERIPLALRSSTWKVGVTVFLGLGGAAVVILWGCFLADYTTTRTVYFTLAVVHVLAEFPFLLRTL